MTTFDRNPNIVVTLHVRPARVMLGTSHRGQYDRRTMNSQPPPAPPPKMPTPHRSRVRLRRLTVNIPEPVYAQLEEERARGATPASPNPSLSSVVVTKLARPLHPDARASRGVT